MCYGETLETRLKWHLTDSRSQVFKHKNNNPKINLIVNVHQEIKRVLRRLKMNIFVCMLKRMVTTWKNVKSNPIKVKQVKFEVKMENETQLRDI